MRHWLEFGPEQVAQLALQEAQLPVLVMYWFELQLHVPKFEFQMADVWHEEQPVAEALTQVRHDELHARQFPVPSIVNPFWQTQVLTLNVAEGWQVRHPFGVPLFAWQVKQIGLQLVQIPLLIAEPVEQVQVPAPLL